MDRPTYANVYETVGRLAPRVLPLFADGWERFPVGQAADIIVGELAEQLRYWDGSRQRAIDRGADAAVAHANTQKIAAAIAEINLRRG